MNIHSSAWLSLRPRFSPRVNERVALFGTHNKLHVTSTPPLGATTTGNEEGRGGWLAARAPRAQLTNGNPHYWSNNKPIWEASTIHLPEQLLQMERTFGGVLFLNPEEAVLQNRAE